MFVTLVELQTMRKNLVEGIDSDFLELYLDAAGDDILSALRDGQYSITAIKAGTFPALRLLQVNLVAMTILEGAFSSEVTDGSRESYLKWVKQTNTRLDMIREGKLSLTNKSGTDIEGPFFSLPGAVGDGRTPAVDLIGQERQGSFDPLNDDTAPDSFPGDLTGESRSPFGE